MKNVFKQIAQEQYRQIANAAAKMLEVRQPKEGWIRTVRMALGMTGAQLSKRLGHNRTMTAYLERQELEGGITLRKMKEVAEAMNCQFVYGIVPRDGIETILEERARQLAKSIVNETTMHMMLEDQALSTNQLEKELERLKDQLLQNMDRKFWDADYRA